MTTAADREIEKRTTPKAKTPWQRIGQIAAAIAMGGVALTASGDANAEGSKEYYREHPVEYARNILGVEPWSKQVEILESIRDNKRVTVRSAHKCGKSASAVMAALWFYDCFDDARVVFTSTTSRQVDGILWRELKKLYYAAGRCVDCKRDDPDGPKPCEHSHLIPGELAELARSGLKIKGSADQREIVGYTASESEGVAGVSGKNILYIPDEASGIEDDVFEAIQGNRAGGGRMAMFSNPTRTYGEFYESHTSKAMRVSPSGEKLGTYKAIHISLKDTPNIREGRQVIPGMAMPEYIVEMLSDHGEDSPVYKVRVEGEFALLEEKKVISRPRITAAESRWPTTLAEGRLFIGFDCAGEGEGGDESVFAARRGRKMISFHVTRGEDETRLLTTLLDILETHKRPRDPIPVVNVDREGVIGLAVFRRLKEYLSQKGNQNKFLLFGIRASAPAMREPEEYGTVRDELVIGLARFVKTCAIPTDARFAEELHIIEWLDGKSPLKATPKKILRKLLGRSPDRFDAAALSVWEPGVIREEQDGILLGKSGMRDAEDRARRNDDDFGDEDTRNSDEIFDPYGGHS